MRVKIIKNAPEDDKAMSIEQFIGREFITEAERENGIVEVDFGYGYGTMTVYPEEYEVIDVTKELDNFLKSCHGLNGLDKDDLKDFILENRIALCKILR